MRDFGILEKVGFIFILRSDFLKIKRKFKPPSPLEDWLLALNFKINSKQNYYKIQLFGGSDAPQIHVKKSLVFV